MVSIKRWWVKPKQHVRGAPGDDACQSLHGRLPTHPPIPSQAYIFEYLIPSW